MIVVSMTPPSIARRLPRTDVDEATLLSFPTDLIAQKSWAGRDPDRKVEYQRLAALGSLWIERGVLLGLEAAQHAATRPMTMRISNGNLKE